MKKSLPSRKVEDYLHLVDKVVSSKYGSITNTCRIGRDDLKQIGYLGLARAIRTHDSKKRWKFEKFAIACIKNDIIDYFRTRYRKELDPNNKHVDIDTASNDHEELKFEIQDLLNKSLTNREREIMHLRFWFGLDLEEIGKRFGITKSRACQIITRAVTKMQRKW